MKNFLPHTLRLLLTFLLIAGVSGSALAQKPNKRQNKKNEEPEILKKLPEFFINDGFISAPLKKVYRRDASRIALRLLSREQLVTYQTVEIPEQLVQSLYNAMVAVRVSDYPCIDSISRIFNVRTFPSPNVNQISLIFEHDAEWAKPLKQRIDTTGSVTINRLMRRYGLTVSRLVYLDEERSGLVLTSKEPVNIPALARKFFVEEGIGCVEEMQTFGDGDDITAELEQDGWLITYSVRFGGCTNKCAKRYDWKFKVSYEGRVTFLGGKGDTIPPWKSNGKKRVEIPDELRDPKTGQPYYKRTDVQNEVNKNEGQK